jgi:hypothetical protein
VTFGVMQAIDPIYVQYSLDDSEELLQQLTLLSEFRRRPRWSILRKNLPWLIVAALLAWVCQDLVEPGDINWVAVIAGVYGSITLMGLIELIHDMSQQRQTNKLIVSRLQERNITERMVINNDGIMSKSAIHEFKLHWSAFSSYAEYKGHYFLYSFPHVEQVIVIINGTKGDDRKQKAISSLLSAHVMKRTI